MHSRPRKVLAEFAGTFNIVFLTLVGIHVAAIMRSSAPSPATRPLLVAALHAGFAYAASIAAFGHVASGLFNPAVTVARWVTHRFSTFDTLLHGAAQLGGATAAVYALRLLGDSVDALGPPSLTAGVTRGQAMLIEGSMTFVLVLTLWATVADRVRPRYWLAGIVAGVVVAVASFAGGPFTGGSMNPARAFGPALASRQWTQQAIYWIGPLAGGVAAASLYDLLFHRARPAPEETHGDGY